MAYWQLTKWQITWDTKSSRKVTAARSGEICFRRGLICNDIDPNVAKYWNLEASLSLMYRKCCLLLITCFDVDSSLLLNSTPLSGCFWLQCLNRWACTGSTETISYPPPPPPDISLIRICSWFYIYQIVVFWQIACMNLASSFVVLDHRWNPLPTSI